MLSDDARRKEYDRQLAPSTTRTVHYRWTAGSPGAGPFSSFTDEAAEGPGEGRRWPGGTACAAGA